MMNNIEEHIVSKIHKAVRKNYRIREVLVNSLKDFVQADHQ